MRERFRGTGLQQTIQAKRSHHRAGGPKELNGITTFFFSNFPEDLGMLDMWEVFFVCFLNVHDQRSMERKLDARWIGSFKLRVNIPLFDQGRVKVHDNHYNIAPSFGKNNFFRKGVSFAKVVSGGALNRQRTRQENPNI